MKSHQIAVALVGMQLWCAAACSNQGPLSSPPREQPQSRDASRRAKVVPARARPEQSEDAVVELRTSELMPVLLGALRSKDVVVQGKAITLLERVGPSAKAAVPELIRKLGSDTLGIRIVAARALRAIGTSAGPELLKAVKSPDWKVRKRAAFALGKCGAGLEGAPAALVKALEDENPRVRRAAAYGLMDLGPEAKEAVPLLLRVLKGDSASAARAQAAHALARIAPQDQRVARGLENALKGADDDVRAAAAEALGDAGVRAATATLAKAWTGDKSRLVRVWAAYALRRMDRKEDKAFEHLLSVARGLGSIRGKRDATVEMEAIRALGKLGPAAATKAVPVLIELLEDMGDPSGFIKAALGAMGPKGKRALEGSRKQRRPEDPGGRKGGPGVPSSKRGEPNKESTSGALKNNGDRLVYGSDLAAYPALKATGAAKKDTGQEGCGRGYSSRVRDADPHRKCNGASAHIAGLDHVCRAKVRCSSR